MPLETFSGRRVPELLGQARETIGEEATVVSLRKIGSGSNRFFELIAADPSSAATYRAQYLRERAMQAHAGSTERPGLPVYPDGQPPVVALVGPTGAGKTTTIAKLANHPDAFGGAAVGLVCLDTYRIGGVEQAQIYAEISRLPLEVVYETKEIPGVLRRLRECGVILVDTPGRGPKAREDQAVMAEQLQQFRPREVHLALPAGLHPHNIRRTIESYRPLGVTHLLPTKVDECPEDEALFRIAREDRLEMRWFTDGQEVPMDLCWVSRADALRAGEESAMVSLVGSA